MEFFDMSELSTAKLPHQQQVAAARQRRPLNLRQNLEGYLFASPWLIGFFIFTLGPFIAAFWISLHSWDILTPMRFIGINNYRILWQDPLFWASLKVTLTYAAVALPLQLGLALLLAMLVNGKTFVNYAFRAVFFLPAVCSGVATAILWRWMLNPEFGLINFGLRTVGVAAPPWLSSTQWALPAIMLMSLWGVGSTMLIYLAGLQSIPEHLYESAAIDGANRFTRFRHITLPMMSSTIFFTFIIGIINSFQIFTQVYVLTDGGPDNSTLFYVLYMYQRAFQAFKMGYASALAWVLFLLVLVITLIQFKLAGRWVYYETEA
jgi:multiple sugar transport system permease protein